MQIKSYKKIKSNLYEITFSNHEKIRLYDDVIIQNELLLTKEIEEKDLNKIISQNSNLECYYKALNLISYKLRTEKELRKKLENYDTYALNYTIKRLKKEDYLNDLLYIKSYVDDAVNLKFMGPNKIKNELKKLGFKEEDIINYLDNVDDNIWISKIDKYVNKKINSNHNLSGIMLKQKILNDLHLKGFYSKDINLIINEYSFNNDKDIYEKEYLKLKNKLSKKYSGSELEFKIKVSLKRKGF